MRAAAIDVGTDSVKVVVGESDGSVRILADHMIITRLGEGLDASGVLEDDAQARTLEAIRGMLQMARGLGARAISVVATSAMRDARNGASFIAAVTSQLGLDIRVLSEEDEGRLSFAAVALDSETGNRGGHLAVVDIGGGSTEFAFGSGSVPESAGSVRIGAVRLTERHVTTDPPSDAELSAVADAADEAIRDRIGGFSCDKLVGVGGSIVNVARVHLQVPPEETPAVHAVSIGQDQVKSVLERLRRTSTKQRKEVTGLDPERADNIIAGIVILDRAMHSLAQERITVSTHGLRHGVLYEMLRAK